MSTRADRLFAEVDRQLEDVREQALATATRAGIVLTAVGSIRESSSDPIQRRRESHRCFEESASIFRSPFGTAVYAVAQQDKHTAHDRAKQ